MKSSDTATKGWYFFEPVTGNYYRTTDDVWAAGTTARGGAGMKLVPVQLWEFKRGDRVILEDSSGRERPGSFIKRELKTGRDAIQLDETGCGIWVRITQVRPEEEPG